MQYPTHFYEWLDFWAEFYHKPSVKASTYTCTLYKLKMLRRLAENVPFMEADEFFCQRILNRMADGNYSHSTISKIYIILKQSFRVAQKKGLINIDPTIDLIIPKSYTKVIKALTLEQQSLVESVCANMEYGHIIIFMLYTGLRRSELQGLTWSDYDEKSREIYVTESKTAAGIRTIPLIPLTYEILKKQIHSKENEYIFHAPTGGPLNDVLMKRLYIGIRESTGIKGFTNHVCRHSFATRLVERGASPKSVSALLGHAKVEYALNIYTSIEKKHARKEIFLLDALGQCS